MHTFLAFWILFVFPGAQIGSILNATNIVDIENVSNISYSANNLNIPNHVDVTFLKNIAGTSYLVEI